MLLLSVYYLKTSYNIPLSFVSTYTYFKLFIPLPSISLLRYNLSTLHCLPCILLSLKIFLIPLSSWSSSFPVKLHTFTILAAIGINLQLIAFTRFLSYNPFQQVFLFSATFESEVSTSLSSCQLFLAVYIPGTYIFHFRLDLMPSFFLAVSTIFLLLLSCHF